jgi:hypothetical protein
MVAFIDAHRGVHGVESICALLPIAPSTYFRRKAEQRDPTKRSARAQHDDVLQAIIRRIWNENQQVYGPRKVWKQMGRERLHAARCRVRRLMRAMGLRGAVRGPRVGDDDAVANRRAAGSSISTRTSTGSPSSARVEGTKPKSYGNAMPTGSTFLSTNRRRCSSKAHLLREPLSVSITT